MPFVTVPKFEKDGIKGLPFPAATESALKEMGITLPKEITLNKIGRRDPHAPVSD